MAASSIAKYFFARPSKYPEANFPSWRFQNAVAAGFCL
jgi:hypothetical protein